MWRLGPIYSPSVGGNINILPKFWLWINLIQPPLRLQHCQQEILFSNKKYCFRTADRWERKGRPMVSGFGESARKKWDLDRYKNDFPEIGIAVREASMTELAHSLASAADSRALV
jgi:hypothetical protein